MNFLRNFVESKWVAQIDEDSLTPCPKGFIDKIFGELESDIIYKAKIAGREVYFFVLTELQSTVDYTMPFRMFKYIAAIFMRYFNDTPEGVRERAGFRLPAVVPILFYNGNDKWTVPRNFKDYLQDGDFFEGIINFTYTLVDIKTLDSKQLIENRDAISAAIAVDKVRGEGTAQLAEILMQAVHSKPELSPKEFDDFLAWFKRSVKHRVDSEEDIDMVISLIKKGDGEKMRTGIDIMFDNVEARAIIETAATLVKSGMEIQEITDRLKLTDAQVEQLEIKLGLKKEFA